MRHLKNYQNLDKSDLELLKSILEEAFETRADMGCNDEYDSEKGLFTKKKRKEICIMLHGEEEAEDRDYMLSNFDYVSYIQSKLGF